jgi:hypothetical protein
MRFYSQIPVSSLGSKVNLTAKIIPYMQKDMFKDGAKYQKPEPRKKRSETSPMQSLEILNPRKKALKQVQAEYRI